MVKTTCEGENRRSPRTASSAGTRLKEEQTAPQIRSPESMKGDTPVDPTEPPDSKFMTASKQPALTLVALAAAEDHSRQLPDSSFASENQAACMNPTSAYIAPARDSPLFPNEPAITPIATSACFAPAQDSLLFPNEPAPPQTTGDDLSPPPVGSTDPRKTDAAPPAAASPPGNLRGSDGPTGDACESTSGTRGFRTAIMYDATIGTRTLGEVRGPRSSEEFLLGRDGATASAPGGALGHVTASFGNPGGTDGPSRGGALTEGSTFQEPRLRGRDRIRFLDGTTAGAPGGAFGRVAASFGNPRGTDSPSGEGGSRRRISFGGAKIPPDKIFSRAETRPEFVPPKIFTSCCPTRAIMPVRIRQKSRSCWSQTPRPRASQLSRLCLVPGCSRKSHACNRETWLLSVRNPPKKARRRPRSDSESQLKAPLQ